MGQAGERSGCVKWAEVGRLGWGEREVGTLGAAAGSQGRGKRGPERGTG